MKRKRRSKSIRFNPNRAYINKAIGYFLEHGGIIIRLEKQPDTPSIFLPSEISKESDEFLRGL